jgi:hypothetical protein
VKAWFPVCAVCLALGACGDGDDAAYEGDEPGECDDNADNDRDGSIDCDDDGCAASPICQDGDADADADADADVDGDSERDADVDADVDGDSERDADADADVDGDSERDADADADVDGDSERDGDADDERDADGEADGDGDRDGDADRDADEDAAGDCPDGTCDVDETASTCPDDCAAICGDTACTHDEDAVSCSDDCVAVCGDSFCTHGENASSCPDDCPACRLVTFVLDELSATSVWVTGDFTDWGATPDAGAIVMTSDAEGRWTVVLDLPPGEHLYKFIVDVGTWLPDPENPNLVDDGYGGWNSVLEVCPETALCGDFTCSHDETAEICPADCRSECGDDFCTHGENAVTCPADCPALCADLTVTHGEECDPPESEQTCETPCGTTGVRTCNDTCLWGTCEPPVEVCNGVDDDCDGAIDEEDAADAREWFRDEDGDGFGSAARSVRACIQPSGYVDLDSDCYDANPEARPGATAFHTWNRGDGSFDYDCDGAETPQSLATYWCSPSWLGFLCDDWGEGWGGTPPTCGRWGPWQTGCSTFLFICSNTGEGTLTQSCR